MKAKPVLVSVVLLAAVCLAGCISKTGTGTGDRFTHRSNATLDGVVVGTARQSTVTAPASNTK